ncbi:hypothetical protein LguiA_024624 [Lonicera macranthoides]
MEPNGDTEVRSRSCGGKDGDIGLESLQFDEEIDKLMSVTPESGNSFTALLELPTNKAVKLLHSPEEEIIVPQFHGELLNNALFDKASKFSAFAALDQVKEEQVYADSQPNSSPVASDPVVLTANEKSAKRKEREKKVKGQAKKSKNVANEMLMDGNNLPYVHVRARRGQATDSHSLAERARREKINARMKLLQELVPGCTKISGTAMVLDEIINHVHSLQRQVELLSMRLATVNPRVDFNLDNLLAAEEMFMPPMGLEGELDVNRQQYQQQQLWHIDGLRQPVWPKEEDNTNFITPDNSHLRFDYSASMHSNQLKMEL